MMANKVVLGLLFCLLSQNPRSKGFDEVEGFTRDNLKIRKLKIDAAETDLETGSKQFSHEGLWGLTCFWSQPQVATGRTAVFCTSALASSFSFHRLS